MIVVLGIWGKRMEKVPAPQHVCMILHVMKSEYLPVERDAMALINKPGLHNHYIIATPCIARVGGLTR